MILFLISLWIAGQFSRFYYSKTGNDTVKGEFYKPVSGAMSFIIDDPIHQVITYSADTMIVYYPDEKKAFKLRSLTNISQKNRVATDLKESIKTLKKAGYIFLKKENKQDTIASYWIHEKLKTTLKIVYDKRGRVFELTVQDQKGKPVYSTKAMNYVMFNDSIFFPEKVITVTSIDTETFLFEDVRLVAEDSLPDIIKHPILPKDVSTEIKGFEEK